MDFSDCLYELQVGQEYLLYADQGRNQKLVTNVYYPNRLLAEAENDLKKLGRSQWRWWRH